VQGVQEELRGILEQLENLEYLAFKEMMASQELKDHQDLLDQRDSLDPRDQEVLGALQGNKVNLVRTESLVNWVNLGLKALRVRLDHKVLWVRKVQEVLTEPKVSKEDRARGERREAKEELERMVKKGHQVTQAAVVGMEKTDHVVWTEQLATQDRLDYRVHVVKPVHGASLG